jgi:glycerophosphoryl diester phosphodiesterase
MARHFSLQGHRGARGLFPENTLDGFTRAAALGVDTVELDVGVTADDVVVVSHNPCLNPDITRTAEGAWLTGNPPAIRSLTLTELRRYDVGRIRPGTAYAAQFPDQQPRDGARIPSLYEVFGLPLQVRFAVELKTFPDARGLTVSPAEMADHVVSLADAAGVTGRLVVQSFDWRGLRHLRARRPDVALAWLTEEQSDAERRLWWDGVDAAGFGGSVARAVAAEGGPIWAPHRTELDASVVMKAHELGLRVIPWDVDRVEDMARLAGWSVDGIITDRPDLARAALGARVP